MKSKKVVNKTTTKRSTKKWLTFTDITPTEKEIYKLLTEKFCTTKQIRIMRNCSKQAINKHITNLQKKGLLKFGYQKPTPPIKYKSNNLGGGTTRNTSKKTSKLNQKTTTKKRQPTTKNPFTNQKRLHANQWVLEIIWKDQRYEKIRKKANTIIVNKHTIKLYRKVIEVYPYVGLSFFASTESEAVAKELNYYMKLFSILEQDLKIILIKNRSQNIKEVKAHFGHPNHPLAKNRRGKPIKYAVRTTDDKKVWLTADDSYNLNEAEFPHSETSKQDSEVVNGKFLNDFRDHPDSPTNSELATHIKQVTDNQLLFAENIKTHIKAIEILGSSVSDLTKVVKKLKKT